MKVLRAIPFDNTLLAESVGLDAMDQRQVRSVLDLAVESSERFRTFEVPILAKKGEDPPSYLYDSANINEFDGVLNSNDGAWLWRLVKDISTYIMTPGNPDLTEGETRLFDQMRTALWKFEVEERERILPGTRAVLLRCLRERMIPCPIPKDNPNCVVCHEPMNETAGQNHRAMKLSCGVCCDTCLETRVGEWVRGNALHCPLCRATFHLLTGLGQLHGISNVVVPPCSSVGFWYYLLISAVDACWGLLLNCNNIRK